MRSLSILAYYLYLSSFWPLGDYLYYYAIAYLLGHFVDTREGT